MKNGGSYGYGWDHNLPYVEDLREYFALREQQRPKRCPESLYGFHSDPDVDGKCLWCRTKIAARMKRPLPPVGYVPDLDEAYGRTYDPDYE